MKIITLLASIVLFLLTLVELYSFITNLVDGYFTMESIILILLFLLGYALLSAFFFLFFLKLK